MTAHTNKKLEREIAKVEYAMPAAHRPYPWGRTRIFGVYCSSFRVVQAIIEFFLALGIVYAATHYKFSADIVNAQLLPGALTLSIALSILLIVCNCGMGLYCSKQSDHPPQVLRRLALSFLFSMVALALIFLLVGVPFHHINAIGIAMALSLAIFYLVRIGLLKYSFGTSLTKKVLIVGDGELATDVFDRLYSYSESAYSLFRLKQPTDVTPEQFGEQLLSMVSEHNISEIVLAYSDRRRKLPVSVLIDCKLSGIAVRNPVEFLERESGLIHFDFLDMGWILSSEGFHDDVVGRFAKRLLDISAGLALLVIASPIIVLTALAIKLDKSGPGPIFYRQIRVGLDGKLFKVCKFRSMYTNAEADGKAQWAAENDARITKVGAYLRKYRLDELPQLFNVLKGEMSLVGPRPERPEFVSQLSDLHMLYSDRHRVKPGLTGWAQMRFPYTANANDSIKKLQYDMYYVKNRSWLLDVLILLQTVEVVLCGKGAR